MRRRRLNTREILNSARQSTQWPQDSAEHCKSGDGQAPLEITEPENWDAPTLGCLYTALSRGGGSVRTQRSPRKPGLLPGLRFYFTDPKSDFEQIRTDLTATAGLSRNKDVAHLNCNFAAFRYLALDLNSKTRFRNVTNSDFDILAVAKPGEPHFGYFISRKTAFLSAVDDVHY